MPPGEIYPILSIIYLDALRMTSSSSGSLSVALRAELDPRIYVHQWIPDQAPPIGYARWVGNDNPSIIQD